MYIIYQNICKILSIVFLQYNAPTYCKQFCIKFKFQMWCGNFLKKTVVKNVEWCLFFILNFEYHMYNIYIYIYIYIYIHLYIYILSKLIKSKLIYKHTYIYICIPYKIYIYIYGIYIPYFFNIYLSHTDIHWPRNTVPKYSCMVNIWFFEVRSGHM